jgi:hypothetical protein
MGVNVISPRQSPHVKPILRGSAPLLQSACSLHSRVAGWSPFGSSLSNCVQSPCNLRIATDIARRVSGGLSAYLTWIERLRPKAKSGCKSTWIGLFGAHKWPGEAAAAKKVPNWQHLQSSVFQVLTKSKIAFRPAVMTFVGERPAQSGRGLPHSKALSRSPAASSGPPGLGVRQSSGAVEPIRSWANYS